MRELVRPELEAKLKQQHSVCASSTQKWALPERRNVTIRRVKGIFYRKKISNCFTGETMKTATFLCRLRLRTKAIPTKLNDSPFSRTVSIIEFSIHRSVLNF